MPAKKKKKNLILWRQHITTTAFHPCSNGMVERCHRQLKDALRARSAANDSAEGGPVETAQLIVV